MQIVSHPIKAGSCNSFVKLLWSLNITPALKSRFDTFHMRGLGYILSIEHSYYSRISNSEVVEQMNLHLNNAEHANITWEQFRIDK